MIPHLLCLSSIIISLATARLSTLLVSSSLPASVFNIRCWIDNQGIVVEDENTIIAEFKEFDCGLGGGKQKNCVKETRKVDGTWLTFRNCGSLEEKSGCKTDLSNITKCYCSEDYCNTASSVVQSAPIILISTAIFIFM